MANERFTDADVGIPSPDGQPQYTDADVGIQPGGEDQRVVNPLVAQQMAAESDAVTSPPSPRQSAFDAMSRKKASLQASGEWDKLNGLQREALEPIDPNQSELSKWLHGFYALGKNAPRLSGMGAGMAEKGAGALVGKAFGTGDTLEDIGQAVTKGTPLPVESAAERLPGIEGTLARGGLGIVETLPKLALLAAAPESLLAQSIAAGGIFGFDAQGNFSPKQAVIGALMPGVGHLASKVVGAALGKAIGGGSKALENPHAQFVLEELGNQAALNALVIAGDSPELIALYKQDPAAAKKRMEEIVGQNLAWALFGAARHYALKKPTATQVFIQKNAEKFGDIADRMMTRRLLGKSNQQAIEQAIQQAKDRWSDGRIRLNREEPFPDRPQKTPAQDVPDERSPEQKARLAATGARMLMRRGVAPDIANRFSSWYIERSIHGEVGERFRSDLNQAFADSGMLDQAANTYSDELNLRQAAEANGFSEGDIQQGISRRAERMQEIHQHNTDLMDKLSEPVAPKGKYANDIQRPEQEHQRVSPGQSLPANAPEVRQGQGEPDRSGGGVVGSPPEQVQAPPPEPQAVAPAPAIQGQTFGAEKPTEAPAEPPAPEPPPATTALDPEQYPRQEIPLDKITLSKDVPNFKGNADEETGVVAGEKLEGKYQRLGTAPIVVWKRLNGDLEVITGRHRLDLARRTGEKTIPGQVVSEADGFTKDQALTFDAEANIRDGQGGIEDYATYFKGTNISEAEARARGLLSRPKGKAGWVLAKAATDDLYALWRAGKIAEQKAVVIAQVAPGDAAAQQLGVKLALAGKDSEFIRARLERESAQKTLATQKDLLGNDVFVESNADAEAEAVATMRRDIAAVVRAGKGAAKQPELAKRVGIDVKAPKKAQEQLAQLSDKLQRLEGQWWLDAGLMKEIKARAGTTPAEKAAEPEPPAAPAAEAATDPATIAKSLGLTFRGVNDAAGINFAGMTPEQVAQAKAQLKPQWDFTDPKSGITFYTDVGASPEVVAERWKAKQAEGGISEKAAEAEKPAEAPALPPDQAAMLTAVQKYRLKGSGPQTYSVIERLQATPVEIENGEQPVRIKNDRTGEESTVLENQLQAVKTRTPEERAAEKAKKKTLNQQLQDLGEKNPDKYGWSDDEKRTIIERKKAARDLMPATDLAPATKAIILGKPIEMTTPEEIRAAVNDPAVHLTDEHRAILGKLVNSGLMERLPGLKVAVVDFIHAGAVGEYVYSPNNSVMRFLRWSSAEAPVHEFFHHAWRFLGEKDQAALRDLRMETVKDALAAAKTDAEREFLQAVLDRGVSSDDAVAFFRQYPKQYEALNALYHLTNDSEFFAWSMTEKAMAHFNRPETRGLVARLKEHLTALLNWVKDAVGVSPKDEALWRSIISGKYEFKTEDALQFQSNGAKPRDLMLPLTPEEWNMERILGTIGRQAGTIGGYLHRYTVQLRKMGELGTDETAAARDTVFRHKEMVELAQAEPGGYTNLYDAVKRASSDGERSEAIHAAWDSVNRYRTIGDKLRRMEAEMKAVVTSDKFVNLLTNARRQQYRAEVAADGRRTYVLQVAGSIGAMTKQLEVIRLTGAFSEQLESDLSRMRQMQDFDNAVAQKFDDIVDTLATDDQGISLLAAGGDKVGDDLWNEYTHRKTADGTPLPDTQTQALTRLAAAVLAANRDMRNQATSLALLARDTVLQTEVNAYSRRVATEIINNPAKAIPRLVRRAANLGEKAGRTEAVFQALNRKLMRTLKEYDIRQQAVALHDAVEKDPEYVQYMKDVDGMVDGLNLPDNVRQRTGPPQPWFEHMGKQTFYDPSGKSYQIDTGWKPETVNHVQDQLRELLGTIGDWLDNPDNANSPSRKYWEERRRLIEGTLMSASVWNPTAIIPLHIGKYGRGAFGMPETFFQGLAFPGAKIAFRAFKNFDVAFTQAKGWFNANWDIQERALQQGYRSHANFNELTVRDYQRQIINPIAWRFRHGREVVAGDIINGHRITKEDIAVIYSQGRATNGLFDIMWNAAKVAGTSNVAELPRIIEEFTFGAWGTGGYGVRRPMERSLHKGTMLTRSFSQHGDNLSRNIHAALDAYKASQEKLATDALSVTPEELGLRRVAAKEAFHRQLSDILNDPDVADNFLTGFIAERDADWIRFNGLSPFEEHYKAIAEMQRTGDPEAPVVLDDYIGYIADRLDAEWTPEKVTDQFLGEITKLTERHWKLGSKNHESDLTDVTVVNKTPDTEFNRAWGGDIGPSFFYDYGWSAAGDMRKMATDATLFAFTRAYHALSALETQMVDGLRTLSASTRPGPEGESYRTYQVGEAAKAYHVGEDFRDLQNLEDKLSELRRLKAGVEKWVGWNAVQAEGVALKSGARIMSDSIGAALTGLRTAGRISGISMGGSAWKMGNVFMQLGYGWFRSHPGAALSAITSMARLGTATTFGWYHPEQGKFTPGVLPQMLLNVVPAVKAGFKAKGAERIYDAMAVAMRNTTDEQFAVLRYWFDQKQLGMTPNNPIGLKVANMLAASRTKGGVFNPTRSYAQGILPKTVQAGKLAVSKPYAALEAAITTSMSYFPSAFGYNITYDAVGRQAGWYIDMLATQARRTFDTYEKLGKLDSRFDFNNLSNPKNAIAPWEALPQFLGRVVPISPEHMAGFMRPNSTKLAFARELFATSSNYDLQDLLLRYWKRLKETPKDQRGDIEFLAPDILDQAGATKEAENRARGIISRFVEQTHHAAPSNRPYQLQKATAFQAILPFMGWSAQTIKQLGTYAGRAAFSAKFNGKPVDTTFGLLTAAAIGALGVGIYAMAGGDSEVRMLRALDRTVNRKETTLKTIDEADTDAERAEIAFHYLTAGIPILNSTFNTLFGSAGYRGSYGFQAFAFDKVNALLNYAKGVYRTHDITYGLDRLAETNIPISETIIENLFNRQGYQNNRNTVRALQKFGPQDLVERRASASTSTPTEMTPYRQAIARAVFSGKPELVQQAYADFVTKARELGRPEPEKVAQQTFSTLNPYRQAFGGLLTDEQKASTLAKMSDWGRQNVVDAERNYANAASVLGLTASLSKEDSQATRGIGSSRSSAGTIPASPVTGSNPSIAPRRVTLGGSRWLGGSSLIGSRLRSFGAGRALSGVGGRLTPRTPSGSRRGRIRYVAGKLRPVSGRVKRVTGKLRRSTRPRRLRLSKV